VPLTVCRALGLGCLLLASSAHAAPEPELRWAGDPEGGAPYLEADPAHPDRLVGFEVDIATLLARQLGRAPRFVFVAFASIDQSVARGDADIGLSGLEDTPTRRVAMATTVPYYQFREVLSVRDGDRARITSLHDLAGRRVGTLAGTIAYDLLLAAARDHGVVPVSYDDDVHPYTDLLLGRVDAVLLDDVVAERRRRAIQGFTVQPVTVAVGHYVGVLEPRNGGLRDRVNVVLRQAMRNGTLERIFRTWGIWNDNQPRLFARVMAGEAIEPYTAAGLTLPGDPASRWKAAWRYVPSLIRAALLTLGLSCLAMSIAVVLGIGIASGRVYGSRPLRVTLTGYVELMRGTPLLLQLFVLYYGLGEAVRLPAFLAAVLGLALNYAAYESEIYRAALEAVPAGQLEAARTLGLSHAQILRLVRGPQAFRLALAPMTNDFVALLKDSSLVSVLTVVELTKQTQIFATNIGSWVVPGLLCATLYLLMSMPLAALARRLEQRWKAATR